MRLQYNIGIQCFTIDKQMIYYQSWSSGKRSISLETITKTIKKSPNSNHKSPSSLRLFLSKPINKRNISPIDPGFIVTTANNVLSVAFASIVDGERLGWFMGRSYEEKKRKNHGSVLSRKRLRGTISERIVPFLRAPVPREKGREGLGPGTNDSPSTRRASVTLDFVIDWPWYASLSLNPSSAPTFRSPRFERFYSLVTYTHDDACIQRVCTDCSYWAIRGRERRP